MPIKILKERLHREMPNTFSEERHEFLVKLLGGIYMRVLGPFLPIANHFENSVHDPKQNTHKVKSVVSIGGKPKRVPKQTGTKVPKYRNHAVLKPIRFDTPLDAAKETPKWVPK